MTAESATSLAALMNELESTPECATCGWIQTLPDSERELFGRYVKLSQTDPRRFTLIRLHGECAAMGYPLKRTAFKDCVRRHHVDQ